MKKEVKKQKVEVKDDQLNNVLSPAQGWTGSHKKSHNQLTKADPKSRLANEKRDRKAQNAKVINDLKNSRSNI